MKQYKYPANWKDRSKRIRDRDKKCVMCGSSNRLQVDHINPISKGGSSKDGNLRTLCVDCHRKRHPHLIKLRRKR